MKKKIYFIKLLINILVLLNFLDFQLFKNIKIYFKNFIKNFFILFNFNNLFYKYIQFLLKKKEKFANYIKITINILIII